MPLMLSDRKPLMRPISAFIFTKLRRSAPLHRIVISAMSGSVMRPISASRQLITNIITTMPTMRNTSLNRPISTST